jgi:hypothetical protein
MTAATEAACCLAPERRGPQAEHLPNASHPPMYPHTTPIIQFETRDARLAREHLAVHHADSAARSRASGAAPRYKLALLTWVAAYALITAFLALLGPTIAAWPLAVRTLVLSVTMVAALTWVIMPRLTKLFRPWLTG